MRKVYILMLAAVLLLMSGCTVLTVDEMYCPPVRSEDENHLQSAIGAAMGNLEYCAPLTGENQQTVQQADLDGDGEPEFLLFAKSRSDKPLHILIFRKEDGDYRHVETIESSGSAFDQVEYVRMTEGPGTELVVSCQVSDQVLRSVAVYTFENGQAQCLLNTSCAKLVTVDLDRDALTELLLLRPGQTDTENGVAELYGLDEGVMERSNEASMSRPVSQLKRVIIGNLHGGTPAVFVATRVDESTIVTDVYALVDGVFTNVSFSRESGTSVQTLRNYYMYAEDIDADGAVELPELITMAPVEESRVADRQYLIRWYSLKPNGEDVDKCFTFHDYLAGWYMELDGKWAERISVVQEDNAYGFYLWDSSGKKAERIFTVYALTGQNREEQAVTENRFVLYRGESTTYAAYMDVASGSLNISREDLISSFHLIRQAWKTGET